MGSIGIQTDIEVFKSPSPYIFICFIHNEDAATQCYLPCTSEAATTMSDGVETYQTGKRKTPWEKPECETAKFSNADTPRKRGRPKKQEKHINTDVEDDGRDNEKHEMTSFPRARRERKIPVKFDPSDVEKTKKTSHSAQTNLILEEKIGEVNFNLKLKDLAEKNSQEPIMSHESSSLDEVRGKESMQGEAEVKIGDVRKNDISLVNSAKVRRKYKGPYECDNCNQTFRFQSVFTRHVCTPDSGKEMNSYPCKICGKLLSSSVNLKRHMLIHSGKPFMCNKCGKTFTGHYLLKEHLVTEHNEIVKNNQTPTDFQCHACLKYMSSKTALEYHQAVKQFCQQCKTYWPCKKSLRDHMLLIHDKAEVTEEGHLICSHCKKAFIYRNHYLNHMAQHSTEKHHECLKCKKFFNTSQALYCHNRQVHEKHNFRHPCSMCEKVFICRAKLVEHMRTHTGEKPFACTECNVAFAAKATYKTHLNLIHKIPSTNLCKRIKNADSLYKYNCPLCNKGNLKSSQLEAHFWKVHNATVQFSNSLPADVPDQNIVIVDGTKDIVLVQGEVPSPQPEESKEIVLSEGTSEVIVLSGNSQKLLAKEDCSEIMVTEESV